MDTNNHPNLMLQLMIPAALLLAQTTPAIASKTPPLQRDSAIKFVLKMDDAHLAKRQLQIEITVPKRIDRFEAPKWYGGAPMFLKFVHDISAKDANGTELQTKVKDNTVSIEDAGSKASTYTLSYTYDIKQKMSGELDQSLPVLSDKYARFDNNLTFLAPLELHAGADAQCSKLPGELTIVPPTGWKLATGWGSAQSCKVAKASDIVEGMIVMGDYQYSDRSIGNSFVRFAMAGDFPYDLLKEQFCKVLQAQQEVIGDLPSKQLLVAVLPTRVERCKGTSLTSALTMNIPIDEKLSPFDFAVIGTASHELFHQWNLRYITPKLTEGAYLLSEGFTNYFAVAALVKAGLIPEERFGKFMCSYRKQLESNPRYPGSDYKTIQAGLEKDEHLFDLCYTKGPFVTILLDLALREDTQGKQSVASWFRYLRKKYGGTDGYLVDDLRNDIAEVSGKPDGQAVKTFDHALLGGASLDLDALFEKLGVKCDANGQCTLEPLSKEDAALRTKLFSAAD